MAYTPVGDIPKIRTELRETFGTGKTRSLEWRRHQLYQLARMVQDNADEFADAIHRDLGKPKQEVFMAETGAIVERCLICAENLEKWAAPEKVEVPDWQKPWNPTIYKAPKGVVLIIAPWNYPLVLSLQPLYGAIAAGCPAVIKPSEIAPSFAETLAKLIPKYLDSSAYRVVLGAVPEITKLLDLQWDHIFYTGNGKIARIISAAAAKHLTPVTLELGGKSPVYVSSDADLKIAARRIFWGKINNAGQICVAPDFVLIAKDKQAEFVEALKEARNTFYPDGALLSDSFSHIVSDAHFKRVTELLKNTKGNAAFGGQSNEKLYIEPTVVTDVKDDDSLMSEELFGPLLPLLPVESIDEAIKLLNTRDHPLVTYIFTKDQAVKDRFINETQSGNLVFNDTFSQLGVNEIPFGGVGESGHGRQVGKYSFEIFSYERSSIDVPYELEPDMAGRYPPYSKESLDFMAGATRLKIPDSKAPAEVNGRL